MSVKGTVYNIQHFSVHDGPGIRTTVFLKGCPLTCWWCHNPESRSPEIVQMNGKTIGERYTPEELLEIVQKDVIFYDQSGGGVTFSGGEPMEQLEFLSKALELCRRYGIHTAVDTSGSADRAAFDQVLEHTDLFLYDLKLMDPRLQYKYTSADSARILENLGHLVDKRKKVVIRVPLIPGITDTKENIGLIIGYLSRFSPCPEVNLLPYHRTAEGKYEKLNMVNRMKGSRELTRDEIRNSIELFESAGCPVKLG